MNPKVGRATAFNPQILNNIPIPVDRPVVDNNNLPLLDNDGKVITDNG